MTNSLIAITGGIGSGKSYVCSMLRRRGIEVYDCDSAAKRIIATSAEVRRGLTRLIGPHTFLADGRLNKAAVAEFLLQSESNAKAINDIVHPAVAADFKKSGVRWMECAILYESGFFRLVDVVIAVTAPEEVRVGRIMQRDGITASKAREWIARQMPQSEVSRRADYVIINDGQHDVALQIEDIINNIAKQKCYRPS